MSKRWSPRARNCLHASPDSLAARFERACTESQLPDPAIASLLGITTAEMWDIRTRGAVPAGALARVRAFVQAIKAPASPQ